MKKPRILLAIPNAQPKQHPYEALNALIDEVEKSLKSIDRAHARLRKAQEGQDAILRRALIEAHDNNELKPLAQYLYFDTPKQIHRNIIKSVLAFFMQGKTVQSWICEGYTYEVTCSDCRQIFLYQVSSFTDMQNLEKLQNPQYLGKVWRLDRCQPCHEKFTTGRLESWEKYHEELRAQVRRLRALPYHEYLKTEHWQAVRGKALQRAKFRCQLCNIASPLHVHHRSYEHLGEEHLFMSDVIALCPGCHAKHHGIDERR